MTGLSIDEWRDEIKPSAMIYPCPEPLRFNQGEHPTVWALITKKRTEQLQSVFGKWRWPSLG